LDFNPTKIIKLAVLPSQIECQNTLKPPFCGYFNVRFGRKQTKGRLGF